RRLEVVVPVPVAPPPGAAPGRLVRPARRLAADPAADPRGLRGLRGPARATVDRDAAVARRRGRPPRPGRPLRPPLPPRRRHPGDRRPRPARAHRGGGAARLRLLRPERAQRPPDARGDPAGPRGHLETRADPAGRTLIQAPTGGRAFPPSPPVLRGR